METVLTTIFILNIGDGILHDLVNLSNMAVFFMITRKRYILTLLGSNDGNDFLSSPILSNQTCAPSSVSIISSSSSSSSLGSAVLLYLKKKM
jgi:hypothetical protein